MGLKHQPFSWKSAAVSAVTQRIAKPLIDKLSEKAFAKIKSPDVQRYTTNIAGSLVSEALRVGVSKALGVEAKFSLGSAIGSALRPNLAGYIHRETESADEGAGNTNTRTSWPDAGPIPKTGETTVHDIVNTIEPMQSGLSVQGDTGPVGSSTPVATADKGNAADMAWLKQYKAWALQNQRDLPADASYEDALFDYKLAKGIEKIMDRVSVSGSGYTGDVGNNLTRNIGIDVYKPGVINAWKARGGSPYLAESRMRPTGFPGGMSADQYRQSKNAQFLSGAKAILTAQVPFLADIKSGIQDFSVDVGGSGFTGARTAGFVGYLAGEFIPVSAVEVGLSVVGASQASRLLPGGNNVGRMGGVEGAANTPITKLEQLTPAHFSTNSGEATFYAGRGNLNRLEAENSSGVTISNTPGGRALDHLIDWSSMSIEESRVIATPYSKWFAEGASGEIRAWAGGASTESVFIQTELPTLLSNPNVTNVTIYDAFNSSKTRIIYPRH